VLGLVLNCVVLWTTVYLDAAARQLKAQGYPVRDEDMARLSPFVNRHLGSTAPAASSCPSWRPAPSATCATPTPPRTTTFDTWQAPGAHRGRSGRWAGHQLDLDGQHAEGFLLRPEDAADVGELLVAGLAGLTFSGPLVSRSSSNEPYWATLFTDVDLPISRVEAKASRGYG
jgi:hypothetical protein